MIDKLAEIKNELSGDVSDIQQYTNEFWNIGIGEEMDVSCKRLDAVYETIETLQREQSSTTTKAELKLTENLSPHPAQGQEKGAADVQRAIAEVIDLQKHQSDEDAWLWKTILSALHNPAPVVNQAEREGVDVVLEIAIDALRTATSEALEMNIAAGKPDHDVTISCSDAMILLSRLGGINSREDERQLAIEAWDYLLGEISAAGLSDNLHDGVLDQINRYLRLLNSTDNGRGND